MITSTGIPGCNWRSALADGAAYGLGQKWSQTVVYTILILVMVFRPTGILGQPTVEKV